MWLVDSLAMTWPAGVNQMRTYWAPWQSVPPRAAVPSTHPPRPTDGEQVFSPDSSTAGSHFAPESGCTPEPQLVVDRDHAFRWHCLPGVILALPPVAWEQPAKVALEQGVPQLLYRVLFFKKCHWNIDDLACCISVRHTSKWLCYTYTCVHAYSVGFPGCTSGKETACQHRR